MMDKKNGIIHVVGPERGLTLPGMTIVCGDSHTSTHGAMGAVAFGIGTSEVEMVMASQCILQTRPKTMRITVDGKLGKGVTAKDVALYMMSKMTTSGATGYFVEYAGEAVRGLTMEGRLTLCNLSIEMGARGGMVAPDETTFEYIKGREYAPKGEAWDKALAYWKTLKSDEDTICGRSCGKFYILAIWVSNRENLCWVRRLTMCFWVPAPMDALRISVHLPPL